MNAYSVSQINQYLKDLVDRDQMLASVFVRGEISNYKKYPSGHHYFSLKDEGGILRCVMFRREAESLRFLPQNGMKVIAFGRVAVFPRDGQYQLYCSKLTADGVGDLHLAFEQLKEKLYRAGLFSAEHKKPIPTYPERIALITSSAGAAVQDMLRILEARWPLAQIQIVPVRVQGEEAAGEIAHAIHWVNSTQNADLIITGRGGGSMEDLWAFNEEIVARAIYHSQIPVISAVGHEPDVTIADYVADLRAATPSNAAELAVPDQNDMYAHLNQLEIRMKSAMQRMFTEKRARLTRLASSRVLVNPKNYLQDRRMLVDYHQRSIVNAMNILLARHQKGIAAIAASLDALSPLKVLSRGYSIAKSADGTVISSVKHTQPDMQFCLRVTDGEIPCRVDRKDV